MTLEIDRGPGPGPGWGEALALRVPVPSLVRPRSVDASGWVEFCELEFVDWLGEADASEAEALVLGLCDVVVGTRVEVEVVERRVGRSPSWSGDLSW